MPEAATSQKATETQRVRVLVDAVKGDHTLFATSEEVLEAWRIVEPVLDAWAKDAGDLQTYPVGTPGEELVKHFL